MLAPAVPEVGRWTSGFPRTSAAAPRPQPAVGVDGPGGIKRARM